MRRVSLTQRAALEDPHSAEVEVVLMQFEHPSLSAPLRLSTDPTERISAEPLTYGTRSSWNGADPEEAPYLFVLASAEVPGDQEEGAAPAALVLENLDASIGELLTSFTDRATVHLAIALASTPDVIEAEFRDLKLVAASGTEAEIVLSVTRAPIEDESVPSVRMTPTLFPGLFP